MTTIATKSTSTCLDATLLHAARVDDDGDVDAGSAR